MGYTKKIISGFSWETLLKIATYGLTVLKIYFLARILDPADFGLFSIALIALGVSESMTQTGINLTIIQSKLSVEYFLDTAWVISIIRGFLVGIIMIIIGFAMNLFYNLPSLITLIALATLVPVIKSFINPFVVVLHKKMYYWQDTVYRFVIFALQILLTIMLGAWTHSAFGLVWALVIAGFFEVAISFLLFKKRPVFKYTPSRAKIIFDNAKWLSVNTLLNYLVENVDDFLIGVITNTHFLGIYHNAYSLTHKFSYEVAKSAHYGTIPVYTRISQEKKRLKKAFAKSFIVTLLISLLISIPIFIFHQSLINFLLGEKWLEVIPLVRPLIIAGLVQTISMSSYTMMLAVKDYKIMNLHLLISLIFMIILLVVFGRAQGIAGAVNAIMWSRIISLPIIGYYLWKYFKHA